MRVTTTLNDEHESYRANVHINEHRDGAAKELRISSPALDQDIYLYIRPDGVFLMATGGTQVVPNLYRVGTVA